MLVDDAAEADVDACFDRTNLQYVNNYVSCYCSQLKLKFTKVSAIAGIYHNLQLTACARSWRLVKTSENAAGARAAAYFRSNCNWSSRYIRIRYLLSKQNHDCRSCFRGFPNAVYGLYILGKDVACTQLFICKWMESKGTLSVRSAIGTNEDEPANRSSGRPRRMQGSRGARTYRSISSIDPGLKCM